MRTDVKERAKSLDDRLDQAAQGQGVVTILSDPMASYLQQLAGAYELSDAEEQHLREVNATRGIVCPVCLWNRRTLPPKPFKRPCDGWECERCRPRKAGETLEWIRKKRVAYYATVPEGKAWRNLYDRAKVEQASGWRFPVGTGGLVVLLNQDLSRGDVQFNRLQAYETTGEPDIWHLAMYLRPRPGTRRTKLGRDFHNPSPDAVDFHNWIPLNRHAGRQSNGDQVVLPGEAFDELASILSAARIQHWEDYAGPDERYMTIVAETDEEKAKVAAALTAVEGLYGADLGKP